MSQPIRYIAITAPSGGAKGTTVKYLHEKYPDIFLLSKSCTTRPQTDDYYDFISKKEFEAKILKGEFAEHEQVSGNYYGTPVSEFENARKAGKILLLDIDVKGASRLKQIYQKNFLFVFIDSGDDISVYESRIRKRNRSSDTEESIARRLARIPEELHIGRFECRLNINNTGSEEELLRRIEENILKPYIGTEKYSPLI